MHRYNVTENKQLSPTTRLLTLRVAPDASPLNYLPGQYAALIMRDRLRPTVARCFSITSSPLDADMLQFSMRVKGRYTSAVGRLKKGDMIEVRGPFGGFVLDQYKHQEVVLCAGGIGIAPFMSMIRFLTQSNAGVSVRLLYSVRDASDVPFQDELARLTASNHHIKLTYVVASPEADTQSFQGAEVISGQLDAALLRRIGAISPSATYFVCGPPPYMQAVFASLAASGVAKERILSEAFSQKGSLRQTGTHRSWPFNMYALTGVSLLVAGFLVAGADLYKTLPSLRVKSTAQQDESSTANQDVTQIAPQVSTDTSQSPDPSASATNSGSSNDQSSSTTSTNTNAYSSPTTVTPTPTVTAPTQPTRTTVS